MRNIVFALGILLACACGGCAFFGGDPAEPRPVAAGVYSPDHSGRRLSEGRKAESRKANPESAAKNDEEGMSTARKIVGVAIGVTLLLLIALFCVAVMG